MARHMSAFAAALALTATVGLAMPASAQSMHGRMHHASRARLAANHAYRVGFNRGFRAGQANVAQEVTTGRSAAFTQQGGYAQPGVYPQQAGYGGPFGGGGLLGTGLFDGQGVLGTGVFGGQGALGLGILGF